jgi:hypothetical protein
MSTVQDTDEISVLRGGTHYRAPVSRLESLGPDDRVAVSRGGTDYYVPGDQLDARIKGTDFLAVGRGGVDYKAAWSDFGAFNIPPINIKSISVKDQIKDSAIHVAFTVLYGSTGPVPEPSHPYLAVLMWEYYYELKTPTGQLYYAKGYSESFFDINLGWMYRTSTYLVALSTSLNKGSSPPYTYFEEAMTWSVYEHTFGSEAKYLVDAPVTFLLRIPDRSDNFNFEREKALPPGTQVRFSIMTENRTSGNKTPLVQSEWVTLPQP